MRYIQDWAQLAEARGMVESCGHSRDEAELDICNALADRKIPIRPEILEIYGSRGLPLGAPALRVPRRLTPRDFDWEKSVTVTPWQENMDAIALPRLRHTRPPRQIVLSIELSTRDVRRVLCGGEPVSRPSKDDLGHAPAIAPKEIAPRATETPTLDAVGTRRRTTSRNSAKRQRARSALIEAFPEGVPDKDHLTNVEICHHVQEKLGKAAETLSNETILRAAGRRK
jgi:hypothetical protein